MKTRRYYLIRCWGNEYRIVSSHWTRAEANEWIINPNDTCVDIVLTTAQYAEFAKTHQKLGY